MTHALSFFSSVSFASIHSLANERGTIQYPLSEEWNEGDKKSVFSRAAETFRDGKAIFSSSVSKNGDAYTPETSCMKGT